MIPISQITKLDVEAPKHQSKTDPFQEIPEQGRVLSLYRIHQSLPLSSWPLQQNPKLQPRHQENQQQGRPKQRSSPSSSLSVSAFSLSKAKQSTADEKLKCDPL